MGGTSQPSHGLHALWSVEIDLGGAEVGFSQVVHVSISPTDQRRKGGFPLPHGEFGLEVIALIGQWRFREHRSVPQMHRALQARGIRIAQRSLTLEGVLVGTPPAQGPFSPLLISVQAVE